MSDKTLYALLIEDNLRDINLAHDMFMSAGVKYDSASNLQEVQEALSQRKYDLIVTTTSATVDPVLGPKAVRMARRKRQDPLVLALGGSDQSKNWRRFKKIHFYEKFSNGVFYTGYKFHDFVEEKLAYRKNG